MALGEWLNCECDGAGLGWAWWSQRSFATSVIPWFTFPYPVKLKGGSIPCRIPNSGTGTKSSWVNRQTLSSTESQIHTTDIRISIGNIRIAIINIRIPTINIRIPTINIRITIINIRIAIINIKIAIINIRLAIINIRIQVQSLLFNHFPPLPRWWTPQNGIPVLASLSFLAFSASQGSVNLQGANYEGTQPKLTPISPSHLHRRISQRIRTGWTGFGGSGGKCPCPWDRDDL